MAASKPLDLEIIVISGKHLKNVNWRNGDLRPYATFYLDSPDHRLATHADDSGSTRPVWNERFTLPITLSVYESVLTLEIFHSKTSETPKPLVGTVKFQLSQLLDSDDSPNSGRKLEVIRPSGRPHGSVRVKLGLKERPLPPPMQSYHGAPSYSHYYNPAPPVLPPTRDYRDFSISPHGYSDPYGCYSAYYPPQPPLPSRPLYNRAPNYGLPSGPSAPVDLSSSSLSYDQKPPLQASLPKVSNYGGQGQSAPSAPVDYSTYGKGGVTELSGSMGGLSLEEGDDHEKEKVVDRESHSYREY